MANVILREGYLESQHIASLADDPAAERFYFHLLLVVDENGRFDANPILLKSRCFPALDTIKAAEVVAWLNRCINADLVRICADNGKEFVEVLRNEPPARRKKEKENAEIADDSNSVFPFADFWNMYGKKVELAKCRKKYAAISEEERSAIKTVLPLYVEATPDVKYRKHPATWLNGRCWEDAGVMQSRKIRGF